MDKNFVIKKNPDCDVSLLVDKKIDFFKDIIQKTVLHVYKNKILDILGINDVNACIEKLTQLSKKINELPINKHSQESLINELQIINNELSSLFKNYGTENLEDMILICFGNNNNKISTNSVEDTKVELLKKYFHPTGYKVVTVSKKDDKKKNDENDNNIGCSDVSTTYKQLHMKVYGIKVCINNNNLNKSIIVFGIVDDVIIDFLNNSYILSKQKMITQNLPEEIAVNKEAFEFFVSSLTLKDYLIYDTSTDYYTKFMGYLNQNNIIHQKPISIAVKEFISDEIFNKRNTLIQLLIKSSHVENQYFAYLLYDLLSNDTNGSIDSQEQIIIFDSFPWPVKQQFKQAMKKTVQYTNDLSNFDMNKIPLEQQICLLKATDNVKEKAMMKLKELKSKSEDSGSKARQYLDGLLKIPFGIYTKEPILNIMDENRTKFKNIYNSFSIGKTFPEIPNKENYTSVEVLKYIKKIGGPNIESSKIDSLNKQMTSGDKKELIKNISVINDIFKKYNKKEHIKCQSSTKHELKEEINKFFVSCKLPENEKMLEELNNMGIIKNEVNINNKVNTEIASLNRNMTLVNEYMKDVKLTLDKAVYGHDKAKKQIERIIGQWINGEQDGYCFGFEGPPGVGKCFAINTPIMLFNGEIKMVQDITLNDVLMGDDSTPRNILALGNGTEKMYKIEQVKADDYIVNESHILSLKMTKAGRKGYKHQTILGKRYLKDDILDICIKDYLSLPKYIKECLKGYKVGIDFCETQVSLDSYALGYWLGDGSSHNFSITTIDEPIIEYFREFANKNELQFKQGVGRHTITYSITTGRAGGRSDKNILINKLKEYNLLNNKHIPKQYKCNSREIRLKLLAGLIDSDGYHNKENNSLEITQKNKTLAEDILWLVRSLGFRGTIKESTKSCTYKGVKKYGQYHRIIITGKGLDEIPNLLERKKSREHKQIKHPLNTGINIIPLNEDTYFGFQIDGNSRFLLGDFTVTHNTSLAKRGLSDCLKDNNGASRPFSMIQMGGDSNGSTLHGHNYTYVGSTWGSIVQILIDKKCMNPIIFIDEVDKISKTEHGKEIVGILTHLLDPAQNDCFQDKYFTGIDIDLSKALFILSYNDAEAIDKILLDRVHRIKFSNLTLDDKLIISKSHILPEVYKKMGLENMLSFSDDVLKFIIDEYTSESGVRKLKEILFEIVGEVNLDILKNTSIDIELPIIITKDDIKTRYFKDKHEIKHKKIHLEHKIGIINGLWANALGKGGVIPIQVNGLPSDKFLSLKLTGMQGDVMKESMNVALTLAWKLTPVSRQKLLRDEYCDVTNLNGVHIHCPEGSVPKDGPSAGTAITTAIFSIFNNKKIKYHIAITGEISLDGNVTEIGGLDLKFIGGIKAGVKDFIFPNENLKDYTAFIDKYKGSDILDGIHFYPVDTIDDVLKLVFENEE